MLGSLNGLFCGVDVKLHICKSDCQTSDFCHFIHWRLSTAITSSSFRSISFLKLMRIIPSKLLVNVSSGRVFCCATTRLHSLLPDGAQTMRGLGPSHQPRYVRRILRCRNASLFLSCCFANSRTHSARFFPLPLLNCSKHNVFARINYHLAYLCLWVWGY